MRGLMDKLADFDGGPNPIDRHVGLRIRLRRKELGISQERLAETIGLTFQQLWEVARALDTTISYFYEGLPTDGDVRRHVGPKLEDFLLTTEGMELARYFPQIPQQGVRRQILELVRTMAVEPEGG